MTSYASLIARLEQAKEGSPALDQEISLEVVGFDPDKLPARWPDIGAPPSPHLPYTTSLDAALSLLPEGWRLFSLQDNRHHQVNQGWMAGVDEICGPLSRLGMGADAPVALCVSCLRARQSMEGGDASKGGIDA